MKLTAINGEPHRQFCKVYNILFGKSRGQLQGFTQCYFFESAYRAKSDIHRQLMSFPNVNIVAEGPLPLGYGLFLGCLLRDTWRTRLNTRAFFTSKRRWCSNLQQHFGGHNKRTSSVNQLTANSCNWLRQQCPFSEGRRGSPFQKCLRTGLHSGRGSAYTASESGPLPTFGKASW